jgi:hypothetical protein
MKQTLSLLVLLGLGAAGFAGEFEPIENSMKFTHKAPKGEKKVSDRIIEGTNSPEELAKTLELYKLMLDCKPPKGEQAAFKEKGRQAHRRHGGRGDQQRGRTRRVQRGVQLQGLPQRAQREETRGPQTRGARALSFQNNPARAGAAKPNQYRKLTPVKIPRSWAARLSPIRTPASSTMSGFRAYVTPELKLASNGFFRAATETNSK